MNAGIYIRTSSEHQAGKASPGEQLTECQALAKANGLVVYQIYYDVEKYRVGGKLVEPSGTRADRPGLVALLKDCAEGNVQCIIAWKEDRLYRGLKAMLGVLEVVQLHRVKVHLVKESFDEKLAPLKAWMAQMELDSMRERMDMGVKARLKAGKANCGQDRYGYKRVGEFIEVVPEEAEWVIKIYQWYAEGVSVGEIRDRLIVGQAPQKGGTIAKKYQWSINTIQGILLPAAAEAYATGRKIQRRKGEEFFIECQPLISEELYQAYLATKQFNKTYPARNCKNDYLLKGIIFCTCGRRWAARCRYKNGRVASAYYVCTRPKRDQHPQCCGTIGSKKIETFVWEKVKEVLLNQNLLVAAWEQRLSELSEGNGQVEQERIKLEVELEQLAEQRQWVIGMARTGRLTVADMDYQLNQLTNQENIIKRQLARLRPVSDVLELPELGEWLEDLSAGVELIDTYEMKLRVIQALVSHVFIGPGREIEVGFKIDVPAIAGTSKRKQKGANTLAGTYTGQFDCILTLRGVA